jgi:hypothetical protein
MLAIDTLLGPSDHGTKAASSVALAPSHDDVDVPVASAVWLTVTTLAVVALAAVVFLA